MSVIYCSINEFDKNSNVYMRDGENEIISLGEVDNSELANQLLALCNQRKVYNVHLLGSDDFLNGIAEMMIEQNITNYGKTNELKIEVN